MTCGPAAYWRSFSSSSSPRRRCRRPGPRAVHRSLRSVRSLYGQGRALPPGLRRRARGRRPADPSRQQLPRTSGRERTGSPRLSRAGDELALRQQRGRGALGAHRPRRQDRRRVPEASGRRAQGRALRTQRRRGDAELLPGRRREGDELLRRAGEVDRLREGTEQPPARGWIDSGRRVARESGRAPQEPQPGGRDGRRSQGHQPGARSVQPRQRFQPGRLDVYGGVQAEVLRGAGRAHEPPHRRGGRPSRQSRKRSRTLSRRQRLPHRSRPGCQARRCRDARRDRYGQPAQAAQEQWVDRDPDREERAAAGTAESSARTPPSTAARACSRSSRFSPPTRFARPTR